MKKEAINAKDVPPAILGSHAVRAGDLVFTGLQVPFDEANGLAREATSGPGAGTTAIDARRQTDVVLQRCERVLAAAGASLATGVRIDQFVTHPLAGSPYLEVRSRYLETSTRPASTHIQVDSLLMPDALIGVQLVALTEAARAKKRMIVVPDMSASPGPPFKPAPHAVIGEPFVFVTGQLSHDFGHGLAPEAATNPEVWYGSPIKLQAEYTIKRCARILEASGASLNDVVRADVYLLDMADRFELDEVWRKYFPNDPPALAYLPTRRLAPKSCIIEINMIAMLPGHGLRKETIVAKGAPAPDFHAPHAIRAGEFVFISSVCATEGDGVIAPAAAPRPAMPWFGSGAKRQMRHIVGQLEAICRAAGTSLDQIAWQQLSFNRHEDFEPARELWRESFAAEPPAALVTCEEGPLLARDCTIMIDAIACVR